MNSSHYVVIMAGGIGSRFWPISRTDYPKQFLDILGTGQTLIQQTFKRFEKIVPRENIYVVTSTEYIPIVETQLPFIPVENILGEPMRRNTAPCVAYICFKLMQKDPDASIIVAPSDHLILGEKEFAEVCYKGLNFIDSHPALITLGIKPGFPSTGYGYIQKELEPAGDSVYPVKRFIEKPYVELARTFVKSEDFLWNSGIFIWKVRDVLNEFQEHLPLVYNIFNEGKHFLNTTDEKQFIKEVYEFCPDISIDFAIMEKSRNVYLIPSSFEWSDLGTWSSAWENMEKDFKNNAVSGKNVMMIDTTKCVVHASSGKLVVVQGLEDFIIADTKDVLLICRKEKEQDIKNYVSEIRKNTGNRYMFTTKLDVYSQVG